jgi:predicted MPP superfamily phosphohydrolase
MVDAQVDRLDGLSQMWNELEPPLGKFAVTGNHEYYAGLKSSVEFMRESGFEVLRGSGREIGENLYIAGVDDPTGGDSADEMALLGNAAKSRYVILLKHRPEVDQMAEGLFDLQLSGHSHRGQIFPFTLLTAIEYPMQNGLYELENSSFLYTSRGTGTWGPPMRIFSPPEITVFEISPAK